MGRVLATVDCRERPFLDTVVRSIEVPDVASVAEELTGRWPRTLLVEADSLCLLAIRSAENRLSHFYRRCPYQPMSAGLAPPVAFDD
jgi:hypothetical protein